MSETENKTEETEEQVVHVLRRDNVDSVSAKTGRPAEQLHEILDELKTHDKSFVILVDHHGEVF